MTITVTAMSSLFASQMLFSPTRRESPCPYLQPWTHTSFHLYCPQYFTSTKDIEGHLPEDGVDTVSDYLGEPRLEGIRMQMTQQLGNGLVSLFLPHSQSGRTGILLHDAVGNTIQGQKLPIGRPIAAFVGINNPGSNIRRLNNRVSHNRNGI